MSMEKSQTITLTREMKIYLLKALELGQINRDKLIKEFDLSPMGIDIVVVHSKEDIKAARKKHYITA